MGARWAPVGRPFGRPKVGAQINTSLIEHIAPPSTTWYTAHNAPLGEPVTLNSAQATGNSTQNDVSEDIPSESLSRQTDTTDQREAASHRVEYKTTPKAAQRTFMLRKAVISPPGTLNLRQHP